MSSTPSRVATPRTEICFRLSSSLIGVAILKKLPIRKNFISMFVFSNENSEIFEF